MCFWYYYTFKKILLANVGHPLEPYNIFLDADTKIISFEKLVFYALKSLPGNSKQLVRPRFMFFHLV